MWGLHSGTLILEKLQKPLPRMANIQQRMGLDCLHVPRHVHFEDLEDDLWPAGGLAAHPPQGNPAGLIQKPMDLMLWTFVCPQGHSTEMAHIVYLHTHRNVTMLHRPKYCLSDL